MSFHQTILIVQSCKCHALKFFHCPDISECAWKQALCDFILPLLSFRCGGPLTTEQISPQIEREITLKHDHTTPPSIAYSMM